MTTTNIKNADYTGTVSFRAECAADVVELLASLPQGAYEVRKQKVDEPYPDDEVELLIKGQLTITKLHELMNAQVDGHVMADTLRALPLAENSLERRYGELPFDWASNDDI